jgi:hypothetical protein
VELLQDGSIEHRLLFSTGIELVVRFKGFKLSYRDARGSDAVALATSGAPRTA